MSRSDRERSGASIKQHQPILLLYSALVFPKVQMKLAIAEAEESPQPHLVLPNLLRCSLRCATRPSRDGGALTRERASARRTAPTIIYNSIGIKSIA